MRDERDDFRDELQSQFQGRASTSAKHVIEKYEKPRRIVQEGFCYLNIVLRVEGGGTPAVEVQVDKHLVGCINDGAHENALDNQAVCAIECHKRGSGSWDWRTIEVTPIGAWAGYYRRARKTVRLAGAADHEPVPIPVYLPVKLRRTWLGRKRRPPFVGGSSANDGQNRHDARAGVATVSHV
jgi:hypothetical protein